MHEFIVKKIDLTYTDDAQLWDSFRNGNSHAFSHIYKVHVQALFRYGSKLSPDTGFVMDCIHDLFVDLSRHRTTVGITDNIRFYLIRSLKHKILRNLKKLHKTDNVSDYPFLLEAAFDERLHEQEVNLHKRRCLRDALNKLPERQKEIIYLRYINDFKNEEIAQIMDITYQAVRNTLHKAIENLRKSISKEDIILFTLIFRNQKIIDVKE